VDDHLNCPIGAHTHAAPMSEQKSGELMQMIGTMQEPGPEPAHQRLDRAPVAGVDAARAVGTREGREAFEKPIRSAVAALNRSTIAMRHHLVGR